MSFLEIPVILGEAAGVAETAVAAGAEAAGETAVVTEEGLAGAAELEAEAAAGDTTAERLLRERVGGRGGSAQSGLVTERGVALDVSLEGAEKVERDLDRMVKRLHNLSPVMHKAMRRMEERERLLFSGGRYVNTGRTRASLTAPAASGAVRKVKRDGLEFGSRVSYARYLVENPGPVTPDGGLRRAGHPSAIMKPLTDREVRQIGKDVADWVMRGQR